MIIYLHGFDSNSPGNHEKVLQLQFIDPDVRLISYSTRHPKHDMQHLLKEVDKMLQLNVDDRPLICGVGLGGKHNKELATFNLDNLRFNKIVICTDADVDGYQIRTLVLTMLYRLTPTLINEGYVYIAESPLYEITTKDRTYFAYTEPEKATFLEEIGDKKYTIQRSKGLGENDPEMMWLTTMNPESRRLIKVMPTDVERTAQVFDILLGDNLAGRKEHIAQHGAEYLDDLDVS